MKIQILLFPIFLVLLACHIFPGRKDEGLSTEEKIQELIRIGLLEEGGQAEIDETNPNGLLELLEKSGKALIMDERSIDTAGAPDYYHALFDLVQEMVREVPFEVTDLGMTAKEFDLEYDADFTMEYVVVTLKRGQQLYQSENYYSEDHPVSHDYFKVINRLLADADIGERLFEVFMFSIEEGEGSRGILAGKRIAADRFGILSLTKEQAETIEEKDLLPICCEEFHLLKTEEIERVWDGLAEAGLLEGLTDAELEAGKAEIFLDGHYSPNDLIYPFPTLYYWFDTETSNLENPYEEITLGLAGISRRKFVPESIVDQYEYDTRSEFSFELNGKKYEAMMDNEGDWLDVSFIELINTALREQSIDGQYYALEGRGQDVTILFLTRKQYEDVSAGELLDLVEIKDLTAVEEGQSFEQEVIDSLKED